MWATRTDLFSSLPSAPQRREGEGGSKKEAATSEAGASEALCLRQIPSRGYGLQCPTTSAAEGSPRPGNRWGRADVHALGVPRQLGRRRAQPRKATTVPGTPWDKDRLVSKHDRRRCRIATNC